MIALIDSIFAPTIAWLQSIQMYLLETSVPLSRPVNVSDYLGPLVLLGPYWMTFITNAFLLAFLYVVQFIIVANQGMFIKYKNMIKWWRLFES